MKNDWLSVGWRRKVFFYAAAMACCKHGKILHKWFSLAFPIYLKPFLEALLARYGVAFVSFVR